MSEYTGLTKINNPIEVVGAVTGSSFPMTLGPGTYTLATAPNAGLGLAAAVGSLCVQTNGLLWRKADVPDTAWIQEFPLGYGLIQTLRNTLGPRQSMTFSGLDGDLEDTYVAYFTLVATAACDFDLRLNGVAPALDSTTEYIPYDNATAPTTVSFLRFATTSIAQIISGRLEFWGRSSAGIRKGQASSNAGHYSFFYTNPATVIASLEFRSSIIGGIDVNSEISLLRIMPGSKLGLL